VRDSFLLTNTNLRQKSILSTRMESLTSHQRASAIQYVHRSLSPGGYLALWENNPWNPGTRYVMQRIPFDREAIPIAALEAQRLLKAEGFEIISTHFLFVFPSALGHLRRIEPLISRFPFGPNIRCLQEELI